MSSWFNINDSLSGFKDQLTNLAGGVGEVLNEIIDDRHVGTNQLSENVTSTSIADVASVSTTSNTYHQSEVISDLRRQLDELKRENADQRRKHDAERNDLIQSLEQLDSDNQSTVDQLVKLRDSLQTDLSRVKAEYDTLQEKYAILRDSEVANLGKIKKLSTTDKPEVVDIDHRNEAFQIQFQHVRQALELETSRVSKLQQENQELMSKIEIDKRKHLEELEQFGKLNVELVKVKTELEESKRDNQKAKINNLSLNDNSFDLFSEETNSVERDNLEEELNDIKLKHDALQAINAENLKCIENKDLEILRLSEKLDLEQQYYDQISNEKVVENEAKIAEFTETIKCLTLKDVSLNESVQELQEEINGLNEYRRIYELGKDTIIEQSQRIASLQSLEDYNKSEIKNYHEQVEELQKQYDQLMLMNVQYNATSSKLQSDLDKEKESHAKIVANFESDLNSKQALIDEKSNELTTLNETVALMKSDMKCKDDELKEYVHECAELIKNHEIMLAELDMYKSQTGLHSISEDNEDNMLQLESDLESANNKINDLQKLVLSMEEETTEPEADDKEHLINIAKSLELMTAERNDVIKKLNHSEASKNELQKSLDKLRQDYENVEYKYNEQIVNLDMLRDEMSSKTKSLTDNEKDYYQTKSKLQEIEDDLQTKCQELTILKERVTSLEADLTKSHLVQVENKEIQKEVTELSAKLEDLRNENKEQSLEIDELKLKSSADSADVSDISKLKSDLNALTVHRDELVKTLTAKHDESMNYYQELQRISQFATTESEKSRLLELDVESLRASQQEDAIARDELDKLRDQNQFLREKCEVLTQNLLKEQSAEQTSAKELERLRQHMMEVEDGYTRELLAAEQRNEEMQSKVNEIAQREKASSNIYTSVSIRTNQQVETLQTQLQLVTNQRDELRERLSDQEDLINKQQAALTNLQLVIEHKNKEKQQDIYHETERIRRQITSEHNVQSELRAEIDQLRDQLVESKQGLQAASRLADQLHEAKKATQLVNAELSTVRAKYADLERKMEEMTSQPDAKVDKSLVRNLVVGLLSAQSAAALSKDQSQILKIIGTVLDFEEQDREKIQAKSSGSWMSSLLHPGVSGLAPSSEESLSLQFVKFLEQESKPVHSLPSLLPQSNQASPGSASKSDAASTHSRQGSSSSSSLLLNELVLPTFGDFGHSRSSSSILKDVLKDNK